MTAQPMIRRDSAERRRLENLLRGACYDAKREMPKVGSADFPTHWDLQHEYLNELLDELEVN